MTEQNMFKFEIQHKNKKIRVGKIFTSHGVIDTPAFIPVGTRATVRSLTPQDLKEIGVQLLFGNTYHLHLRPGEDIIAKFGGLGKFMNWDGVTITDSGGFQVFSLGKCGKTQNNTRNRAEPTSEESCPSTSSGLPPSEVSLTEEPVLIKITEDGVNFRSHIDGSLHTFTSEESIGIQQKLGADIILVFDECAPYPSSYEYTKEAMIRTHNWAVRSLRAHRCHPELGSGSKSLEGEMPKPASLASTRGVQRDEQVWHDNERKQALYGIIQGGIYKDLREESAKFICKQDFEGIAIGGVSVGESKKEMRDVLDWVYPYLPEDKPRHLLGIGEIDDIFDGVERGMDTFDCVIPTRFGRYGIIFVSPPLGNAKNRFRLDINKSEFEQDKNQLDKNCKCYVCQNFTRAYINHLFRSKELLAYRLAAYHNVYFIIDLMRKIREAIGEGKFDKLKKEWLG